MTKKSIHAEQLKLIERELSNADGNYALFFSDLKERYDKEELAYVYNYLLERASSSIFLKSLIREIDKLRNPLSIDGLIDFLLMKENYAISSDDANDFIDVRVMCAKSISNFKDIKAVTPLLYCLNNKRENYKFRLAAAEALGKIGDKNAVESLIDVVSDENEKSVYVREGAAAALGMIGDMRAVDAFLGILETKKSFLDKFSFLKERVVEALGKIDFSGNKRVLNAFKKALEDESPQVRVNAIESLMNSECLDAVDLIWGRLYDENKDVALSAVAALYNLGADEILNKILEDETMPYYCIEEARNILEDSDEE